ncbi:DUF4906 domain-containing protein [Rikenella microfusus]|uniref:Major fimbrial subunit protein (FimA) n=1 Tax=Rikenella microfusus TaxID=28139 RepID=A0A379MR84_9BACT|nr:DUF4906 domain-containing protein [Rikenella microfusus]SUE34138.1 Major fimbrial subunit protein (FimA) [Rikenella microfusus]
MKRSTGLWALLILMCTSCAKFAEPTPDQEETAACRLTLSLAVPEPETITRALNPEAEKSVSDLNLYLFSDAVDKHYFISPCASSVILDIPSGNYELFLVANIGDDLGTMTRQQLETYRYRIAAEEDLEKNGRLPMYARQTVTVEHDMTLPVTLTRLTAKVEIRCTVAEQAGALTLNSMQVKSASADVLLFGKNRAAGSVVDYAVRTLSGRESVQTAYVLENCQGVNSSVTSQDLKDSSHAPQNGTYVIIRGSYAEKSVTYRIYLGENNTSDFNVRENRHYVLNVLIYGANPGDCRVSVMEMDIAPLDTQYTIGRQAVTTLTLANPSEPDNFYMLTFHSENARVSIDGRNYTDGETIPLLSGTGNRQATIALDGMQPGNASVVFTVTDRYGIQFHKTVSTRFVSGTPIIITSTPFSSPYTNTVSTFEVAFSEAGYTGDFTVKLTPQTEPPGAFTFNGENLEYNFVRTVAPGTYPMTFNAANFVGNAILWINVRDSKGQSKNYSVVQAISAAKTAAQHTKKR